MRNRNASLSSKKMFLNHTKQKNRIEKPHRPMMQESAKQAARKKSWAVKLVR